VQFVDEHDELPLAFGDLFEDRLEPFFELATVLGTCDQRAQVQLDEAFVLEALRHVAVDDALR
jgi:hypothetical protein